MPSRLTSFLPAVPAASRPRCFARLASAVGLASLCALAQAQPQPSTTASSADPAMHSRPAAVPNAVVVAGTVPDEATRQAILQRTREVYGAERVIDQLGVGAVVAPPNWNQYVQRLVSPDLKRVSRGQLAISGNTVDLKGEVANEAMRQQLVSDLSTRLNPTYTVRNGLHVRANEQAVIDSTLANRIVEFESGSALLTDAGRAVLDELLAALRALPTHRKLQVIGHTDSQGGRDANIALSAARADTVKAYLAARQIPPETIEAYGVGPDRPVADNSTAAGRSRNRRIEFRVIE
jgi:OmpA-OmpF porin, OOP family